MAGSDGERIMYTERILSVNETNELIKDLYLGEDVKKHPTISNIYVTKSGKVISIALERKVPMAYFKSTYVNKTTGYEQLNFRRDGKPISTYMHTIVLETYNPKPQDGKEYEADHLNSVRTDNRLENLQWVSKQDNLAKRDAEGSLFKKVYIYDITKNDHTIYDIYESRILAAKSIDMFRSNLTKYIKLGKVVRNNLFICDYELTQKEYEQVIKNRQYIRKPIKKEYEFKDSIVFVYNRKTKTLKEYSCKADAAKDNNLQTSNITTAIKYGGVVRNDLYITESDYLLDSDYEYIFKEHDLKVANRKENK